MKTKTTISPMIVRSFAIAVSLVLLLFMLLGNSAGNANTDAPSVCDPNLPIAVDRIDSFNAITANLTGGGLYPNCNFVPDGGNHTALFGGPSDFLRAGSYYAFFAWETLPLYQAAWPWANFISSPGCGPNTDCNWRVEGCGPNACGGGPPPTPTATPTATPPPACAGEIVVEQPAGNSLTDNSTTPVTFPTTNVGGNTSLTFTIRNLDVPGSLTVNPTISIDGTNAGDFAITQIPTNIGSGVLTFVVRFAPSSGGTRAAALHIANSDCNENPFDIRLTGNGQVVPVTFTITPSAGPNGAISPNTPRTVSAGGSVTFSAIPASGYVVDRWFVNGLLMTQIPEGSTSATFINIQASYAVHVTFKLIPLPSVTFAPNSIISIQAVVNARLVVAEAGGQQPLIANRTALGLWERFQVIDMGSGTFALKSLANGKFVCAENAGASPLIANRNGAGAWEQFRAVDVGKGIFALIANINERYVCAESAGSKSLIANRSGVSLWEQFRILYPSSIKPVTVTASLQAGSNGAYVSADAAGTGSLVANRPILGGWEQLQFVDLGTDKVGIKARINNLYVTAESAGAGPLIANRSSAALWEQFQLMDAGEGYVALRSLANNQYVSSNNPGGVLQAKSYYVGSTERFLLNVGLRSQANNLYVSAEFDGNSPLIARGAYIGNWEQFQFVNVGNGNIALKARTNGRYVCAENGGASPLIANRASINGWEQFQWIVGGNGNIALKAVVNDRFVSAENNGASPLIANRTAALNWEQFR